MRRSSLHSLIVEARVYLWSLQAGYHQRLDQGGPWLRHNIFTAALVANPGPKLQIYLLSAAQLERIRRVPPHLAILPEPPFDGAPIQINAKLATPLIRLGRQEGWRLERGGLPLTIDA